MAIEIDPHTASLVELKAFLFDEAQTIKRAQDNINTILPILQKRMLQEAGPVKQPDNQ